MVTTIQVSKNLLETLKKRKLHNNESYEEVIWDLIEDTTELSEETKREIGQARVEVKKGKFYTLNQVKKELGL